REVRQDDVGGELAQRADEPLLRVRDAVRDAQPGTFQLAQLQLGVGRIVLGEQQPEHRDVRLRAGHQWMNLLRPHHNNALPFGLLDKLRAQFRTACPLPIMQFRMTWRSSRAPRPAPPAAPRTAAPRAPQFGLLAPVVRASTWPTPY